ncbi:hypothetical protein WJX81_003362 [Elliptochloris bilobata]|uniref:Uncharacterized protein n=1 Tax=Elliptochloris bilobata TaxID=381761 RepID=A0AAW1RHT9_9CHLO
MCSEEWNPSEHIRKDAEKRQQELLGSKEQTELIQQLGSGFIVQNELDAEEEAVRVRGFQRFLVLAGSAGNVMLR